ncbi:MAG: alpha/beta hydrolase [Anaerolineales bacterium]|jgi:acetyl esterase/lipase
MHRTVILLLFVAISLNACVEGATTPATSQPVAGDSAGPGATPSLELQDQDPRVVLGLGYRPDAFFENQVDLYLPASRGDRSHPAVLLLHGGGEDKHNMERLAYLFVEQGYAAVAANFRSMGGGEYPGTVEDAFCALAWMVDAATEYGLDTSKYTVVGFSMGGTLAAMLGVVDQPEIFLTDCPYSLPADFELQGAVVFTGIFDYASAAQTNQAMQEYIEGYLGATMDEDPELWDQASALSWVDGSEPPFLLLHGEADINIDPAQTEVFADRLASAGVAVEKIIVPGVEHYGLIADEDALQAMFQFILQ